MRLSFTLLILLLSQMCQGQKPKKNSGDDTLESRIVLIGDAGSLINGKQNVIDGVRKIVPMNKKTTVLFMGDNLYTVGLPDEQYSSYNAARSVLDTQANLVKNTPAKAYFMPGNHDWANGKPGGLESVIRQQVYIDQISADNVKFFPEDGCPGPVQVSISKDVLLIIMDSQWWLNRTQSPGIESDCPYKTKEEVLTQLKDIIVNNPTKLILFACHHPFKSTGVHSGYYGIKQHIFPFTDLNRFAYIPLPVIGSIYPIARGVFGSPQDMAYPAYANMISEVEDVLKTHAHVIHISGHEHNLQFMQDSSYNYIISGAGCKMARVGHNKKTKFSARQLGFAVMEVSKNKNVNLKFYEVPLTGDTVTLAYSDSSILDFSKLPDLPDTVTVHDYVYKDSVTVPVNAHYAQASRFKRFVFGNNYREEWAQPVKLKVFDIKNEKGGFKIEGLSGGKQSKSLHLVDKKGQHWVLRSINKDPSKAIPANLRDAFPGGIVQDMISASHPYGAAVVPPLSDAAHVIHANPEYFFVPDDYTLGYYRPLFANTVCELEEAEPTPDHSNAKSTYKIFNKMIEESDHTIDQHALLRARLIDLLIADFDRHQDQWKWGSIDTGKGKVYYPIPKDRDQALFYSDGTLTNIVAYRFMPFLRGFKYDIKKTKWQGYVARDFDRTYLNELDENDWKTILDSFKNEITDSVISKAAHQLPPEIYAIDGKTVEAKLRSRRDLLPEKAMIYYKFISREVNILGSNQDEYFEVKEQDNGLRVTVYERNKKGDTNFVRYSRYFDPTVTHEVRLYGFNGNDYFHIDENAAAKIKFRIIGGRGNDTFDVKGHVDNYIYDLSTEDNPIVNRSRTFDMRSPDPLVNDYQFKQFSYDTWRFLRPNLGYNTDDGVMIGIGMWGRTHGFRKDPYSTDQRLNTLYSFQTGAYQLTYRGEFIHVIRNYDLLVHGEFMNPAMHNFFGFGNETKFDQSKGINYYRARYKDLSGDALLQKRLFGNLLSFRVGPSFYYYWDQPFNNNNRLLADPKNAGLDSTNVYARKSYAGGKLELNIYNLNNELFPTRGIDWTTTLTSMAGLNGNSNAISKIESNMAVFASLTDPARVVAALHLGWGQILSRDYEYFQAFTLGANDYLRGFRKDRFSGSAMAYASIELRVKVCDVKSFILPGTFGVIGFNDAGRVWVRNDHSHKIHDAYGAGLYYTPFNYVLVSGTVALSGEETLFNFSIGTKLNITF